jgi:hypothetical protein
MLSSPDAIGERMAWAGSPSLAKPARSGLRARENLEIAPPMSGATREDIASAERSRPEPHFETPQGRRLYGRHARPRPRTELTHP